jgi:hypothetical protein
MNRDDPDWWGPAKGQSVTMTERIERLERLLRDLAGVIADNQAGKYSWDNQATETRKIIAALDSPAAEPAPMPHERAWIEMQTELAESESRNAIAADVETQLRETIAGREGEIDALSAKVDEARRILKVSREWFDSIGTWQGAINIIDAFLADKGSAWVCRCPPKTVCVCPEQWTAAIPHAAPGKWGKPVVTRPTGPSPDHTASCLAIDGGKDCAGCQCHCEPCREARRNPAPTTTVCDLYDPTKTHTIPRTPKTSPSPEVCGTCRGEQLECAGHKYDCPDCATPKPDPRDMPEGMQWADTKRLAALEAVAQACRDVGHLDLRIGISAALAALDAEVK